MKPGIPWSVKGIEQEARVAAKDAARRSGMTLGEWLSSLILETAGGEDDLDRRYGGTRLGERAALEPGTGEGAVKGRLDQLARQLTALAEAEAPAAGGLSQVLAAADEEALLERVLQRIDAHRHRASVTSGSSVRRLDPYSSAALLRRRSEEHPGPIAEYPPVESALRHVIDRIEVSESRTCEAIRALEGRLPDLAAEVRQARKTDADDHVQSELARIAKDIEALRRSDDESAKHVHAAAVEAARTEVREAERRLEGLIAEAQRGIRSSEQLADSVSSFGLELDGLKQRLAEHISESASDREPVAAVERHVARLADRLAGVERRLEEVTALERFVAELARSFEEARGSMRGTVESPVAEGTAGHVPDVSAELKVLEEGLTALRASAASADERTKEALDAVHRALDHIVGKLRELESDKIGRLQPPPVPRIRAFPHPRQEADGPGLEDFIAAARRAARSETSDARLPEQMGMAPQEGGGARRWSLFRRIRSMTPGGPNNARSDSGRRNRLLLAAVVLLAALASFPANRPPEGHPTAQPVPLPAAEIKPVDITPQAAPRALHRQAEARGLAVDQTNSW
jgi:localization factor PodJL